MEHYPWDDILKEGDYDKYYSKSGVKLTKYKLVKEKPMSIKLVPWGDNNNRFVMHVWHDTPANAITLPHQLMNSYNVKVIADEYCVNIGNTEKELVRIVGFYPEDEIGKRYGRVIVERINNKEWNAMRWDKNKEEWVSKEKKECVLDSAKVEIVRPDPVGIITKFIAEMDTTQTGDYFKLNVNQRDAIHRLRSSLIEENENE